MTNTAYIEQVSPPNSEPITLEEAKLFLRVDGDSDDSIINNLIQTVRINAEQYMRCSLMEQSWKIAFDSTTPYQIELPRSPILSIIDVKNIARDGTEIIVDNSTYYLSANKTTLTFDTTPIAHRIEISYLAGFSSAYLIPANIKQGLLIHIAQMFDDRNAVAINITSRSLYDNFRKVSL